MASESIVQTENTYDDILWGAIKNVVIEYNELEASSFFKQPMSNRDVDLPDHIKSLLANRYFVKGMHKFEETMWRQLCRRVSRTMAAAACSVHLEKYSKTDRLALAHFIEKAIYIDLLRRRFLFNSPNLFSAGTPIFYIENEDKRENLIKILYDEEKFPSEDDYYLIYTECVNSVAHQLLACFVIPVEDNITDIFDSVKNAALITKYGGGVGVNFSNIREADSLINQGYGGKASGPLSFMQIWNTMGEIVVQGGRRRAALMGILDIDHPDIMEFIDSKTEDNVLSYFNISVSVSDAFMNAVDNNENWELKSRLKSNYTSKVINAKALWAKLGSSAWKRGDPGIFFMDTINKDSLLSSEPRYKINATNPCGEQNLPSNTSCNLGSIDVSKFVNKTGIDSKLLWEQSIRAALYLDLVISATSYPSREISHNTLEIRPIGLGVMGIADALIKQQIRYGSDASIDNIDSILRVVSAAALYITIVGANIFGVNQKCKDIMCNTLAQKDFNSISLNNSKSALLDIFNNGYLNLGISPIEFEEWLDSNIYAGNMRNSRRLSIAPTGSISMIADTSSSIEPNFAWKWDRKITKIEGIGVDTVTLMHPLLTREQETLLLNNKPLSDKWMVTTYDLTVDEHMKVLAKVSEYSDSGVSKTINMSKDSTVDDVLKVYKDAYTHNVKGLTIYRDGSRSSQPIVPVAIGEVKPRPNLIKGSTSTTATPWGTLYATLNFEESGKPFETFLSIGKTGSEIKALTEALSRIMSIAMRSGCKLESMIKTLDGLGGSELWAADFDDNIGLRSLPDAIAKILKFISDSQSKSDTIDTVPNINTNSLVCPECKSPMDRVSGCAICFTCGYSKCK